MSGKVTHGPRSANSRREAEGGLQEEENRGQLKKGTKIPEWRKVGEEAKYTEMGKRERVGKQKKS